MQLLRISEAVLVLLLAACATQAPAAARIEQLQTATSWAATARMAANAWLHGDVPGAYARRTLHTAAEEIHSASESLAQLPAADARTEAPGEITPHIDELEAVVREMAAQVERQDHAAMAAKIERLTSEAEALSTLARTVGGQP